MFRISTLGGPNTIGGWTYVSCDLSIRWLSDGHSEYLTATVRDNSGYFRVVNAGAVIYTNLGTGNLRYSNQRPALHNIRISSYTWGYRILCRGINIYYHPF